MRDTSRHKESYSLSLDSRQVASVVVASLVILGAVFILGLNVGKQLGERDRDVRPPADPLAALDAPPAPPDGGEPPKLSYHEALTKNRPPEPVHVATPKPPPPPPPKPVAPATPVPAAPAPEPVETKVAAADPEPSTAPEPAKPAASANGSFAIQVGSTQDLGEAQRIADRFKGHKPRIVSAEIPGKGRWYRVKLGSFENRPDAERYLKDLSRETNARGFVTSRN